MDNAPQEPFYTKDEPNPMADLRGAMSRNDDFEPGPETYAGGAAVFEVLAALEAPEVEGEVLA